MLSSVLLYAGGVVLNDVFDADLDRVERPERPIPSGLIPLKRASFFGGVLLIAGVLISFLVNTTSGIIALILAVSILIYDAFSKKDGFLGPLNMGICRALNLMLGMSVLGSMDNFWYGAVPMTYIFAITLISRGEVHGNNKKHIIWAGILYSIVIFMVAFVQLTNADSIMQSVPFVMLFGILIFGSLIRAYNQNTPQNIKKAVKTGVLSLIVLDAAMAVGFSDWYYGLLILALLPISFILAKLFAVT